MSFCTSVAANSTSFVSDASMVLPSVPGSLEAREDFVEGSEWFLPAAPSLLGGITGEFWSDLPVFKPYGCFAAIDAAMLLTPLSEDWPFQLGVWPAPSFQPYVFAALHAAMLFTSNWILVLEDVRGLCCEYETDLLLDMLSFGHKTSLKGMTKGKRFLAKLLWSISPDLFFHLPQVLPLEISAAALVAAYDGGHCVRPSAAAAHAAALEVSCYAGMVEMVPGSFAHVVPWTQGGLLVLCGF